MAFNALARAGSHLTKREAVRAAFSRSGGKFNFFITADQAAVTKLCITAVSLCGIYQATPLAARAIDGIVNRGLGGPRDDQGAYTTLYI